jgi:hypothetical protein
MPHGKLLKLSPKRIAEGSMLQCLKQRLRVGVWEQGPVVPTQMGVAQGSPLAPL